jgi:hypothetical protein
VWDKRKKSMFYFGMNALDISIMVDKWGESPFDKGIPIMQCTGLRDKNGKLIYEGDIVKFDYEYGPEISYVSWYKVGGWGFHDYEVLLSDFREDYIDNFEVLGNRFENADLLTDSRPTAEDEE